MNLIPVEDLSGGVEAGPVGIVHGVVVGIVHRVVARVKSGSVMAYTWERNVLSTHFKDARDVLKVHSDQTEHWLQICRIQEP